MSVEEDLQLEVDEAFLQRERRFEGLGVWALSLLLAVALLGGLGSGVLSWAERSSPLGSLTLRYERVEHRESDAVLEITVNHGAGKGPVTIALSGAWVRDADIRGVTPTPAGEQAHSSGVTYDVDVAGSGPARITLSYRSTAVGMRCGTVTVDRESVEFCQLLLP